MLASDEEGAALDALRFSLASDIVELVVLTTDEVFLQTLREAVGGARRLWHVPSGDKVSDLLVAGEVGILVLDVLALAEGPAVFIGQIKRQFPDLVVVVAGNREAETSLAGLISAGIVYRFIHKPMSPGRAKLFADAAVKRYDEQRRRIGATPPIQRRAKSNRGVLTGGAIGAFGIILAIAWGLHRAGETDTGAQPHAGLANAPQPESPILIAAATALAANRLIDPAGDNALELYLRAQANNPADPIARAGVAEVRERLLARAENALLEERLDEAAAAIETAQKSGVDGARIAFLTAQLDKSRERVKAAQAAARAFNAPKPSDQVSPLLDLAAQRVKDAQLIEPEQNSALFYVREALRLDPGNAAAHQAETALATRLLAEGRAAVDRRDFTHAIRWIEAAKGIAAAADTEAVENSLAAARKQADTDAWTALLRNAADRLQEDRLIEPADDSAKYYLLTLRGLDPGFPGLGAALQDLGARLVVKARRAVGLAQYDAARSWLDEAAGIGYSSPDLGSARHDLDAALARQQFLANVVDAGDLTVVKSVKPKYPAKAEARKVEGWVELDFTVTEKGEVRDIGVHAVSAPGVFEDAATSALSQWRYKPVMRDAKAVTQRARIRIRFTLAG